MKDPWTSISSSRLMKNLPSPPIERRNLVGFGSGVVASLGAVSFPQKLSLNLPSLLVSAHSTELHTLTCCLASFHRLSVLRSIGSVLQDTAYNLLKAFVPISTVSQSTNQSQTPLALIIVHLVSCLVLKYTSDPGSQSIHALCWIGSRLVT